MAHANPFGTPQYGPNTVDFSPVLGIANPDDGTVLDVKQLSNTPQLATFNISGTVNNQKVSGVLTIHLENKQYAGWDWNGTPDLSTDDDTLQVILNVFESVF